MGAQHILRAGRHHGASGPVGPASVSPAQWMKADAGTSTTTNSTANTTWSDQSGHGRNVSNSGTARPLYKTGIFTGGTLPALLFDGVDDFYFYLPGADWITGTGLSIFTARKRVSTVGNNAAMALAANGITDDYNDAGSALIGFESSGGLLQDYRVSSLSTGSHPGDGVVFLDGSVWDGTNDTRYLNGTAETSQASSGSFAIRNLYLGCRFTGSVPAFFGNYYWGEVLIYDQALSPTDVAAVFAYLGRWSA